MRTMHSKIASAVLFSVIGLSSCRTTDPVDSGSETLADRRPRSGSSEIDFGENTLDVSSGQYRGQTYLAFMKNEVRPRLNAVATKGYAVGDGAAMKAAFNASHSKVKGKVSKLWGGIDDVARQADKLRGKTVTMDSLPGLLSGSDKYGLATFIGLASGGGVKVKYADQNIAYNVHYAVKEQRSGRSFGTGPGRGANDASDKQYLDDIEEFGERGDFAPFYDTLIKTLLSMDSSGYRGIKSDLGQAVLTDFLAVYTAEQARNLMDGKVTLHWDAALLEVTLLAAFHSGQSNFQFYYTDPKTKKMSFVSEVYNQSPGCNAVTGSKHAAQMHDYWQFSKSPTKPNCSRSGINITKNEFRRMGRRITSYMIKNHKAEYSALANAIGDNRSSNVYESFSKYILLKVGDNQDRNVDRVASAWVDFLAITKDEANQISSSRDDDAVDTSGEGRPEAETADQVSGGFDAIYAEDEAVAKLP